MRTTALLLALVLSASPAVPQEDTGQWQIACVAEAEPKRCEAAQTIFNAANEVVLRIAFGQQSADGERELVLRVPQGVLLREAVSLKDGKTAEILASAEYLSCFNMGCFAQTNVSSQLTDALDGSGTALVTFKDRAGRQIEIVVPFAGLAAALDQIAP